MIDAETTIHLTLPWPPSVNNYWRAHVNPKTRRPINILSARGREYREACAAELLALGLPMMRMSGRLSVHIIACPPDRRKRDLDNLPKSVLDALTKAEVWIDDSQIDDLRITRGEVLKGGCLRIIIRGHSNGI